MISEHEFFKKNDYRCPICKAKLVVSIDKKSYETLNDHISNPNGDPPMRLYYHCGNICTANQYGLFWSWFGESYYSLDVERQLKNICQNQCTEALGSTARRLHFEAKYRDNSTKYLSPKITFGFVEPKLQYEYTVDPYTDEILSKKLKIEYLKKGKFINEYCIYWIPPWRKLKHKFQRKILKYKFLKLIQENDSK